MADVLRRDRSPVMAAAVLLDHHRVKVRVDVLPDHRRVKVQVGVLPDHRPVMALAAALQGSPAAVGALRDHRRVMAAEGTMVVATAVGGKAATAVEATSSSTVNRYLLTVGGNGAPLRRRQHAGDDGNIAGFASLAPAPGIWKFAFPTRRLLRRALEAPIRKENATRDSRTLESATMLQADVSTPCKH